MRGDDRLDAVAAGRRRSFAQVPGREEAMSERGEVYESLDLSLRIGEVLLRSGAGAADVSASMLAVTRACGVHHVLADVTFVDLAVRHQPSAHEPAAIQMRRVIRRPVDYEELIEADRIVNDLVAGTLDRGAARDQLANTVSTGHVRSRWAVTLGWGLLGTGIALTLGGERGRVPARVPGGLRDRRDPAAPSSAPDPDLLPAGGRRVRRDHDRGDGGSRGLGGEPVARDHRRHRDAPRGGRHHGRHPGRTHRVPGHGQRPDDRRSDEHRRHHRRCQRRSDPRRPVRSGSGLGQGRRGRSGGGRGRCDRGRSRGSGLCVRLLRAPPRSGGSGAGRRARPGCPAGRRSLFGGPDLGLRGGRGDHRGGLLPGRRALPRPAPGGGRPCDRAPPAGARRSTGGSRSWPRARTAYPSWSPRSRRRWPWPPG